MADLYIGRHGDTAHNKETPGAEKVRSWAPVPLDAIGQKTTEDQAKFLAPLGIGKIHSSDIHRAVQSTQILKKYLPVPVEYDQRLRDWNAGELTGKDVEEVKDQLDYYRTHHSESPKGGESYGTFLSRWGSALQQLLVRAHASPQSVLTVTHQRNLLSLKHILTGGHAPIPNPSTSVQPWTDVKIDTTNMTLKNS